VKDDERDAYRIPEFCARHGFSPAKYFQLAAAGEGPRVMRVGKRVLISREAASEWRRSRESAVGSAPEKTVALNAKLVAAK
jgi:hypothetical protein